MRVASQLVEDYLNRTGKPRDGELDGWYHHQWFMLRDMLGRLEVILEDEQVPHEVTVRVLRCLLYGSPSPADAELRMETDRLVREELARTPPVIHVDGISPEVLAKLGLPPK